ncbi:MAG TPA: hypothetical protein EYO59_10550, partial [Chromatiaceae bacterium]|nr:hypothetical protein [Chromatiaceae bacterium]
MASRANRSFLFVSYGIFVLASFMVTLILYQIHARNGLSSYVSNDLGAAIESSFSVFWADAKASGDYDAIPWVAVESLRQKFNKKNHGVSSAGAEIVQLGSAGFRSTLEMSNSATIHQLVVSMA